MDLVSENSAEYIDSLVPSSALWDGHVPGDGRHQAGLVGVLSDFYMEIPPCKKI